MKTIIMGCVFFVVVLLLSSFIAYLNCIIRGISFNYFIAFKVGSKGGLIAAFVAMLIFNVKGPRPRN